MASYKPIFSGEGFLPPTDEDEEECKFSAVSFSKKLYEVFIIEDFDENEKKERQVANTYFLEQKRANEEILSDLKKKHGDNWYLIEEFEEDIAVCIFTSS